MDIQDYINAKLVHEIHTSERKSYRACRRRWDWIFRQNYYPKLTAKPLEFGVAYHQAMEVFYDPDTWFWPSDGRTLLATGAFIEKCEEQKKKFLTQSDVPYLEEEVEEDYNARIKLGKGMLEYYCGQLSPTIDKGWHPVKVEIPFMVPIPHPYTGKTMWCKCDNCWTKYYEWSQKLEPPPPSQGHMVLTASTNTP